MEIIAVIAIIWLFFLQGKVASLEEQILKLIRVTVAKTSPETKSGDTLQSASQTEVNNQYMETPKETEENLSVTTFSQAVPVLEQKSESIRNAGPEVSSEQQSAHWLGIAGIIALVIGTGLFFKYAIDNEWITPVMQIALFAGVGITLIVFGLLPKLKREFLGGLLAGGGYAVLFLTIFAAHTEYYSLITDSFLALVLYTVVALSAFVIGFAESMPALLGVSLFGLFIAPYLAGEEIFAILPWYSIIFSMVLLVSTYLRRWYGLAMAGFVAFSIHFQSWFAVEDPQEVMALAFVGITGVLYGLYALAQALRNDEGSGETLVMTWFVPMVVLLVGGLQILDSDYHGMFALILAALYFLYTLVLYAEKKVFDMFTMHHAVITGLLLVIFVPLQWSDEWLVFGWLFLGTAFTVLGYTLQKSMVEVIGFSVSSLAIFYALVSGYLFVNSQEEPLLNTRGAILISIALLSYIYVYLYSRSTRTNETYIAAFLSLAQIASVWLLTTEIAQSYFSKLANTGSYYYNSDTRAFINQRDTAISSVWGVYALALITIGFALRQKILRYLGLTLFFITAIKIFTLVWTLGGIWKSVAFIAFSALALLSSYLYTRYKDRL